MNGITIPRGSIEYVEANVWDTNGGDLTDNTVEVSIHKSGSPEDWISAEWHNGYVRTTAPIAFNAPLYTLSAYEVSVRVTDAPEQPIVRVGTIRIVR